MMRDAQTIDRWIYLMMVATILLVSIFYFQPRDAYAASCSCNGSVSVNTAGQIAAPLAGYTKADFESDCTHYGFSASGWSCSGSLTADTNDLGADCNDVDADYIIGAMGLSSFSGFISASLRCTEVTESTSTSSSAGGGGSGKICSSSTCIEAEVGPFMQGISQGCGNLGDCTLEDIMLVFVNIGNYVVGIIGAVVLLMYVAGGFYWLASAGRKEWVDKGKKYMTISTVGLLIVMFSYLGIYSLRGALQYGTVLVNEEYVTCVGSETDGDPCGLNSTCTNDGYTCESKCVQSNKIPFVDESSGSQTLQSVGMACVDINDKKWSNGLSSIDGCQKDFCPGGASTQCCEVTDWR